MKAQAFTVVLFACALPRQANAWSWSEHRELGEVAFSSACDKLIQNLPPRNSEIEHRDMMFRYEKIACKRFPPQEMQAGHSSGTIPTRGSTAATGEYFYSGLFGQSCAVAGDYLGKPEDFLSDWGARMALSTIHYGELALVNYGHFHPLVLNNWKRHRLDAMNLAARANQDANEISRVMEFERGLFTLSFSDHFLQDSFAAGHMGFNRAASSAGSAKSFHDIWSAEGRMVMDSNGSIWKTFGDEHLFDEVNADGLSHVSEAEFLSVYGFLYSFVVGEYPVSVERELWQRMPIMAGAPSKIIWEDPGLLGGFDFRAGWVKGTLFGGKRHVVGVTAPAKMEALKVMNSPAQTSSTVDFWTESTGRGRPPREDALFYFLGLTSGNGLRNRLGIGYGFSQNRKQAGFAVDEGILWQFAQSGKGLFTHDLQFGYSFANPLDSIYLAYKLNMEVGARYYYVSFGPAWVKRTRGSDSNDPGYPRNIGYLVEFGIGRITSARGGGVLP